MIQETFRTFSPEFAANIAEAAAGGKDALDVYLIMLLLADEKGEVQKAGLDEVLDLLLSSGAVEWGTDQDAEGSYVFVGWTPNDG